LPKQGFTGQITTGFPSAAMESGGAFYQIVDLNHLKNMGSAD
jgi:hypothetical protein